MKWSWLDDDGHRHTNTVDEVLFFPESPVNILGVTKYADQLQDGEGTSIHTKWKYSIFTWNFGKHTRTFDHPPSGLPELQIDNGIAIANNDDGGAHGITFCVGRRLRRRQQRLNRRWHQQHRRRQRGDLAASPAASGDVDDNIDDGQIGGDIDITDGDDGGSRGITCRVGRQ